MNVIEANGAKIPAIGLGTWELRGRTCARIVEQALRLGYRHIDTAQMYENEREVGERLEHRVRGMRDHGEQRAGRSARRALALLPVADGLDGHAELGGELHLGEAGAAAKVAHRERARVGGHPGGRGLDRNRLDRKLLPVPQLDDPSVRLQPQPHVQSPKRGQ